MEELFREKLKFFWGGVISSGIYAGFRLFAIPPLFTGVGHLVMEYAARFAGTVFIAFVSGVLTVMFKDFYDIVMKKKTHSFFYFLNKKLTGKKKVKKDENNKRNAA